MVCIRCKYQINREMRLLEEGKPHLGELALNLLPGTASVPTSPFLCHSQAIKWMAVHCPLERTFCLCLLPVSMGFSYGLWIDPAGLHPSYFRKPSLHQEPTLVTFYLLQAPVLQDWLVALTTSCNYLLSLFHILIFWYSFKFDLIVIHKHTFCLEHDFDGMLDI